MKATKLNTILLSDGKIKESEILIKMTNNLSETKTSLFISDSDNEVWNTELVSYFQNNCTWFNNNSKKGFTVIFK